MYLTPRLVTSQSREFRDLRPSRKRSEKEVGGMPFGSPVFVGVARPALTQHLTSERIKGGEKRSCAVTFIVVSHGSIATLLHR